MNRLSRERSPYLLQHAHNPVDWFPWSDEAFAKARAEDKPIFLSIGYSTCHWCHVMEHESFENDAVAAALNADFIAIKVDREERPDVDRVYMTFVQATTGSGGWPMSVWLTPDLKPFYGGTYFPPSSRWGRPGFPDVLQEVARVWRTERSKVTESAETLTARLRSMEQVPATASVPGSEALERCVRQFTESFDARHGGFGDAPKFPRPSELLFLLREHARTGEAGPRDMVLRTLRAMALGGMRDHLGGGFHRYSVDAAWRVPHFEKMLYDQAQLVLAYLEAAQVSGDPFYAEVADETLFYVLRELRDACGGFHSAEDADSVPPEQVGEAAPHASEGAYYLWRAGEIDALLGEDAAIVKRRYGVEADGNAPMDPQQEFTGKNLLYVARSVEDLAKETGKPAVEIVEILQRGRTALFTARLQRPAPHRDDKILTAWNGLMIAAFARMVRVLRGLGAAGRDGTALYLEAAVHAALFAHETLWVPAERRLRRRYRDGHAEIDGYAEDYAFLIFGLLELFQTDANPVWLEWAIELQHRQDELFWDDANGAWFSTTGEDPTVLLRMKEDYDGAEPTASSISVLNLLTLTHFVHDAQWTDRIERTLRCFGARLEQTGRGVPMMAAALSVWTAGVDQIVLVEPGAGDSAAGERLGRIIATRYLPFAITLSLTSERHEALAATIPMIEAMQPVGGAAAVYVCRNFACRRPVTTPEELTAELSEAR
jgi:uncharacterized protein